MDNGKVHWEKSDHLLHREDAFMLLDYALLLSTVLFSCGISRDEHSRDRKSALLAPDRQQVVDEV